MNLIEKVENFGKLHSFLQKDVRILIGLSGGPDSLCLTLLLKELSKKYSLFLIAAHVNYHLRGEDSDLDEAFVKEFCYKENIPLYIYQANINKNESLQNKAREIRFEYFQRLKKHYKIDYIALGHQMDDQTETVLQRLLRGAGFTGLSGINPKKDGVIHPILNIRKSEILEYLSQKGIIYRVDITNQTNNYTRNKIRNELLPYLKKEYNPNFEQKLIEYGNLFFMADSYFSEQIQKIFKKALISRNESDIIFDLKYLRECPPIFQFYLYREAWTLLIGTDKDFYTVHFQEIIYIVESESGYKEITLPNNILVIKDYGYLIFRNTDLYTPPNLEQTKELTQIRNVFSFNDQRFTMQKIKQYPEAGLGNGYNSIVLDLDKIIFPITLRYRKSGDRFIPFGMENFKKLKNFFIDEKVGSSERDMTILFTDAEKIFWVCGYRLDQRVAISKETKNYLLISSVEDSNEAKNRSAQRKQKKNM